MTPPGGAPGAGPLEGLLAVSAPDGGRIVLHVASGTYVRLDGSAGAILDLLGEEGDEAAAAGVLAARYGIDPARAAADVRTVIDTLARLRPSRPARPPRPSLPGTVRRLREWWGLPLADRMAVTRAAVVLCAVEVGLRVTDIRHLATVFRVPLADRPSPGGVDGPVPSDLSELSPAEQRRCRAVDWVLARWVLPGTCLRRALLTGFALRRRRPRLRLGLTADGVTAHAWVEAGDRAYDPGETVGVFRAVG